MPFPIFSPRLSILNLMEKSIFPDTHILLRPRGLAHLALLIKRGITDVSQLGKACQIENTMDKKPTEGSRRGAELSRKGEE